MRRASIGEIHIMKPVTQKLLSIIQSLTYGKVVRSALFLLLIISCGLGLKQNPIHSAIISLIAFVAFDVVCAFKRPKFKDFSEEISTLQAKLKASEEKTTNLESQFKEVKSDLSVAKISTVIGQARR
jgi:hypothetical protein